MIPLFMLSTLVAMRYLKKHHTVLAWVRYINQYSFGIYLAHPMFFAITDVLVMPLALPITVYVLLLIVMGCHGLYPAQ